MRIFGFGAKKAKPVEEEPTLLLPMSNFGMDFCLSLAAAGLTPHQVERAWNWAVDQQMPITPVQLTEVFRAAAAEGLRG